jgi:hypothetical protein
MKLTKLTIKYKLQLILLHVFFWKQFFSTLLHQTAQSMKIKNLLSVKIIPKQPSFCTQSP